MTSDFFGLTDANAMGTGAQHSSSSSQDISTRMNQLISDMEDDHKAVAGGALGKFRETRTQLEEAFAGLKSWCEAQGVRLGEGQQMAQQADQEGEENYGGAMGSAPSIPPIAL